MTRQTSLEERYGLAEGTVMLTGVQALVRLPLDQHRADLARGAHTATLISGYPGSPLAGFDLELGRQRRLLDEHDIVHQPGVNEELAATAVYGSQIVGARDGARFDGVVGLWYGKAPGLDRATDAIRHGNLIGTAGLGGAVALSGDDALSKSSTLPSAVETTLFDLGMPIVMPGDVQEVLDFGLHAIALSRISGLWTGLKMPTNIADSVGTVEVSPTRIVPVVPDSDIDGRPFSHVVDPRAFVTPRILELEGTLHGARAEMARRYAAANGLNDLVCSGPRDRIGLVASGKTFIDLQAALRKLGIDPAENGIRLLKLGMPYPLERGIVERFAQGLERVVVIEEKREFIEMLVKDVLQGHRDAPPVWGARDQAGSPLIPKLRELDPDAIALALASLLGRPTPTETVPTDPPPPLPVTRRPYFCSGCPHNSSTKVPDGAVVGAGIGCHTMVTFMDPDQVGDVAGVTQMGGEGAQWIGMAPFTEQPHIFQNLGDGTYTHSGSLAVRAAVAAKTDITFKLLVNSAVAMTGGQPAVGQGDVRSVVSALVAEGVSRVTVTTDDPDLYRGVTLPGGTKVVDRRNIVEVQEELARTRGVTVLLHDQECAAVLRRKRKRNRAPKPVTSVLINERVCEGCGDCGQKSNCLSVRPVDTEFGRKTQIHEPSCNKDYTCLEGDCPSFITVVPGKKTRSGKEIPRSKVHAIESETLPEPELRVPADRFSMRITGVGGTGVVTVSQILGAAALFDGQFVRGLDQTGLAQMGGPVVSDLSWSDRSKPTPGKLSAGSADLYLGCDLLVAADQGQLVAASEEKTVGVISTAEIPTGSMITNPAVEFPPTPGLLDRISRHTRDSRAHACDAQGATEKLFGNEQAANLFLVGVAYQAGALPLRFASIEQAITLNGAAIETNIQAFRHGRLSVSDPEALDLKLAAADVRPSAEPVVSDRAKQLIATVGAIPGGTLEKRLGSRVDDLRAYQNDSYAARYVEDVASAAKAEQAVEPGQEKFATAVAAGLHKLMAYKDEYEVARLHLDPEMRRSIEHQFGEGARAKVMLHPPVLRAMGMKRKIALGRWITPVLTLLRAGRRLRGTVLDPFGPARVRRVERRLIVDYREAISESVEAMDQKTMSTAIAIARLPDQVRGYEDIKLANVEVFDRQLAELRQALLSPGRGTPLPVVEVA